MTSALNATLTFCLRPLPGGFPPDPLNWDPGPGDIALAGTVGGGPGSAAGDRRCIDLCEVGGACIVVVDAPRAGEWFASVALSKWAWPLGLGETVCRWLIEGRTVRSVCC